MCCSGNHNRNKNSNQSSTQGNGFHLPMAMMMICCLLPIIAVSVFGAAGIGGIISKWAPALMIVVCLGSHFLMKGHQHGETDETESDSDQKANQKSCH